MERRSFIQTMCAGGIATFALPSLTFAQVPGPGRLLFVLLRGGFDGLAAVVPYGDDHYRRVRESMAFDTSELTALESGFGLAPGLSPLNAFWDQDELIALHGMAIPFRTRSHFDGQAVLETGLDRPDGASDGWLNRLLQIMEGERGGIAVAAGLPRSLAGEHPVTTWSPARLGVVDDDYIGHLHGLYQRDPVLLNPFEAALQMQDVADASQMNGMRRARGNASAILNAAARFLRDPEGPNVASVEFSGWDTHANQGMAGGALDRLLGQLAEGLTGFKASMGDAWQQTTVVVMTEFGRTVEVNGTRGTDHGTGGAGFVLGPRVAKSAVVTDWPGLAARDLFEGRDLRPTLDTRAVLKGVLAGTFDLTSAQANRVFPGSVDVRGYYELMG